MKRLLFFIAGLLCLVLLSACTEAPPAPATSTPKPASSATPIPTPGPTAELTARPTASGGSTPVPTPYTAPPEGYTGPFLIHVNRYQNRVIIYGRDAETNLFTQTRKIFVCSCGANVNDTPTGTFYTSQKYDWKWLNGGHYGQYATRIVDSILFHSVPYDSPHKDQLQYAEYARLGQNASQGCIRMTVEGCKWIYDNCPPGTCVVINSDPAEYIPPADPVPMTNADDPVLRGWDPTDPDPANPWKAASPTPIVPFTVVTPDVSGG